ncbi:MAG: DNA repair protein RecN [Desulfobacterales bacterium]|nr:MAG: DNA repair protein RecN [Desulfobacterales bacterium]UCD89203.1 MAG: DNA repair protein RecN [Desulfobacterales bacterium]
MLQELSIKNFAIIDDLNMSFSDGLTILSGETGAGKSIIINAVNLLLGSRASTSLIRTGYETAELEALFHITKQSKVFDIMKENGYEPKEGLLVRRVISKSNRHRIFINGRLATIQLLNSITQHLASISGQHAHQVLLKEDQHLLILDMYGGLTPLRNQIYRCFHDMLPLIQKLNDLYVLKDRQIEHRQLLEFQHREIKEASIQPGEDTDLELERVRLKNRKQLLHSVQDSIESLYSSKGAVIERLVTVKQNLERASEIDAELLATGKNVAETIYHLEDLSDELRTYLKKIEIDENRLETIDARLDTLNKLKRKYGKSLEAVLARLDSIANELSEMGSIEENISDFQEKLAKLHGKLGRLAKTLSQKRQQTGKSLAKKVEQELDTLRMPQTKFRVRLQTIPANNHADPFLVTGDNLINETGIDRATFLISPNIGEPLKPFSNIVSGGELSRVVLALKAILAKTELVETIVFDEVDAGISGSVGEVIGKKLSSLARYHQIICITHLPQIAKFGDHHFSISKRVIKGRTKTSINRLTKKERIKEIARMLGGEKITQATLDHAHEMMDS